MRGDPLISDTPPAHRIAIYRSPNERTIRDSRDSLVVPAEIFHSAATLPEGLAPTGMP